MKNWHWKDVVMLTALLIGMMVEIALAASAVIFVLYEIWQVIGMIFTWLIANIPDDAIPFLFFLLVVTAVGIACYDHFNSVEYEKEAVK